MQIGVPGKMTGQLRDDGKPVIEYTREQLLYRVRVAEGQINSLTAEVTKLCSMLANDESKTFYL